MENISKPFSIYVIINCLVRDRNNATIQKLQLAQIHAVSCQKEVTKIIYRHTKTLTQHRYAHMYVCLIENKNKATKLSLGIKGIKLARAFQTSPEPLEEYTIGVGTATVESESEN